MVVWLLSRSDSSIKGLQLNVARKKHRAHVQNRQAAYYVEECKYIPFRLPDYLVDPYTLPGRAPVVEEPPTSVQVAIALSPPRNTVQSPTPTPSRLPLVVGSAFARRSPTPDPSLLTQVEAVTSQAVSTPHASSQPRPSFQAIAAEVDSNDEEDGDEPSQSDVIMMHSPTPQVGAVPVRPIPINPDSPIAVGSAHVSPASVPASLARANPSIPSSPLTSPPLTSPVTPQQTRPHDIRNIGEWIVLLIILC